VKGKLNNEIEVKWFLAELGSTAVSTTGQVSVLTAIGQGVNRDARVGDRVKLRKLTVNFRMVAGVGGALASADAYNNCRIIVFRWYQDNAVDVPTRDSILRVSALTTTDYTIASYNKDFSEQFKIIMDENFTVYNAPVWNGSAVLVEPGPGHVKVISKTYANLGDRHLDFGNNATTGTNHIYVLCVTDSAFAPHATFSFSSLVEYQDA